MHYPESVASVLDDTMRYRPLAIRALKRFARRKPWRGSYAERREKFTTLVRNLAAAYGIPCPQVICDGSDGGDSGRSCYVPASNTIILRGRLSVVTALHEFGHALGKDEREACRWSVNLFRKCFPQSWRRAQFDGHMIRRGTAA
jgi:hypothetical protein